MAAHQGSDDKASSFSSRVDRQSPKDRILKDIIRGLYEGRFEAGQRLIEAQLTEDYGVSRGPVREALNRLDAMGIVELTPQRGAVIRILSLKEAIDGLIVTQGVLGITARLAAERIDADGEARLRKVIEDLKGYDQASTSAEYALARDQFYSTLAACAANATLSRILMQIQIHLIRVQFRPILRAVDRRRHQDYLDIADAVFAGNPAQAEKLVRKHMGRSLTALLHHVPAEARQVSPDRKGR